MTIEHVHGSFRIRLPLLWTLLTFLRLPAGWLVQTRDLPHDPECTPTVGVLRS